MGIQKMLVERYSYLCINEKENTRQEDRQTALWAVFFVLKRKFTDESRRITPEWSRFTPQLKQDTPLQWVCSRKERDLHV